MLVRISFEIFSSTEAQDKYLREAMERMVTGQYTESDLYLVAQTYKARVGYEHLSIRRVEIEDLTQL